MTRSWPQPNRAAHKDFVTTEGWEEAESTHHDTYELTLPDGRILRTRISRPPSSKKTYGERMWSHILRDQLDVTEGDFWACVENGELPDRGLEDREAPGEAIPVDVATLLASRVGLSRQELRAMTAEQAIARLNDFWTTGR